MSMLKQYKNSPAEDTIWSRFIGSVLTNHKGDEDFDWCMECPECDQTIFGHYEFDGNNFFFVCNECGKTLAEYNYKSSQAIKDILLSEGVWK